ncbi:MAG: hypothetical protein OXI87_19775 [Albidovulum sp.]|nr:hypothetical protein [Albidovulum sp.]
MFSTIMATHTTHEQARKRQRFTAILDSARLSHAQENIVAGRIPPVEPVKIDAFKVMLGTGESPVREFAAITTI